MIVGIGVDLCEVARMKAELARNEGGFRDSVFTPAEIDYCLKKRSPDRHFAARFAAKEAVWKALGTGAPDAGAFRDAEIFVGSDGAPRLVPHGRLKAAAEARAVRRIWVSLTHTREHAIASVVLETVSPREVAIAEL